MIVPIWTGSRMINVWTDEPTDAEIPFAKAAPAVKAEIRRRAHALRQYVELLGQIGEDGAIRRQGYDPRTLRWVGRR